MLLVLLVLLLFCDPNLNFFFIFFPIDFFFFLPSSFGTCKASSDGDIGGSFSAILTCGVVWEDDAEASSEVTSICGVDAPSSVKVVSVVPSSSPAAMVVSLTSSAVSVC